MKPIPITKPCFNGSEVELIKQCLESGWVTQGPLTARFEREFAELTGASHAIAVSSCTAALHLALLALELKPGDEVILPSFTFVATANAVINAGATPVFCDIDLATFNIDPALIENRIGAHTRAILPVHLFGLPAAMDSVLELAERYSLAVIEDAACGFGACYHGRHVGTFGLAGCFSFHPRKAITTGEGGLLTVNDEGLAKKLRSLREHGVSLSDLNRHQAGRPYDMPEVEMAGLNYRLSDLQAALGLSQLQASAAIMRRRRELARRYDEALKGLKWFRPQPTPDGMQHGYQAYVGLCAPFEPCLENLAQANQWRNRLMDHLIKRGIATRPGTHAVHNLAYYRERFGIRPQDYPCSLLADQLSLALPLYPDLEDDDFKRIIAALMEFNG